MQPPSSPIRIHSSALRRRQKVEAGTACARGGGDFTARASQVSQRPLNCDGISSHLCPPLSVEEMGFSRVGDVDFGNANLDPSVLRELPEGSSVLSTNTHKISFWAKVGRIDVLLSRSTEQKAYFIKVVSGDVGRNMVMSEFESLKTMHQIIPEFVPTPIAWGSYETVPDTHFILCQFRNMTDPDTMPDTENFTTLLAKLHQESESPDGRFGFHVTTYPGNLPQYTGWEENWETFFTKAMRQTLSAEIEIRGRSDELDSLSQALFDKVIPRLLRPLESDGRSVKPSLVHGDLWYANTGTDIETGECLVFDPCCFYAHNECEYAHFEPATRPQTKANMKNIIR